MILEAEVSYGQSTEGAFALFPVVQTHYSIANTGFNKRFLTRNRFTKAQVT